MTLSVNGSLQDGKYVKGSFSEIQIVAGSGCTNDAGVVNGCVVDLSGLPLLQLPKKQLNVSATQKIFPWHRHVGAYRNLRLRRRSVLRRGQGGG